MGLRDRWRAFKAEWDAPVRDYDDSRALARRRAREELLAAQPECSQPRCTARSYPGCRGMCQLCIGACIW